MNLSNAHGVIIGHRGTSHDPKLTPPGRDDWPAQTAAKMSDLVNAFLLIYAGLFPIVNPVGGAPLFLAATRRCTERERGNLALRVSVNSFFLLLGSLFIGSHVLEFFGITLPVVRIAGGLVVSVFGWTLLRSGGVLEGEHIADPAHPPVAPTDSFYPLTMPLTVGPGSISVAITLGSQRPKTPHSLIHLSLLLGTAVVGLAAIAATVFLCYRFADRLSALLGERGIKVLMQLSAFIMLCIGIQIIWSGYSALMLH